MLSEQLCLIAFLIELQDIECSMHPLEDTRGLERLLKAYDNRQTAKERCEALEKVVFHS